MTRVLRYIYRLWRFFLQTAIVLSLLFVLMASVSFIALQTPSIRAFIVNHFIDQFNESHRSHVRLGAIHGVIPSDFEIEDLVIELAEADSSRIDTVLYLPKVNINSSIFQLLRGQLKVDSIFVYQPYLHISQEDTSLNLKRAFQPIIPQTNKITLTKLVNKFDVIVPSFVLKGGEFKFTNFDESNADRKLKLPKEWSIRNLSIDTYAEYSQLQRFLGIKNLSADVPELGVNNLGISGQVFNDSRFFELNSFEIALDSSVADFSFSISDMDFSDSQFSEEIEYAKIDLNLKKLHLNTTQLQQIFTQLEVLESDLDASLKLSLKQNNDVQIEQFSTSYLGSNFELFGNLELANRQFNKLPNTAKLSYKANINDHVLRTHVDSTLKLLLHDFILNGNFTWQDNLATVDQSISYDQQRLDTEIETSLSADSIKAHFTVNSDSLNLGFIKPELNKLKTRFALMLNGDAVLNKDFILQDFDYSANFKNGYLLNRPFKEFSVRGDGSPKASDHRFYYSNLNQGADGRITALHAAKDSIKVDATILTRKIDLQTLAQSDFFADYPFSANSRLSIEYHTMDDFKLALASDIMPTPSKNLDLPQHHYEIGVHFRPNREDYVAIKSPALDVEGHADLRFSTILDDLYDWFDLYSNSFKEDFLFKSDSTLANIKSKPSSEESSKRDYYVNLNMKVKEPKYLDVFMNQQPLKKSNFEFDLEASMYPNKMKLNIKAQDSLTLINNIGIKNFTTALDLEIPKDKNLLRKLDLLGELKADSIKLGNVAINDAVLNFEIDKDSVKYKQRIGEVFKNARFDIDLNANIQDSLIDIKLPLFKFGNYVYGWVNNDTAELQWKPDQILEIEHFELANNLERVELEGILSRYGQDRVGYFLKDIDLGRLSTLLEGNVQFSGMLNGAFNAALISDSPYFDGKLEIKDFALGDKIVGDVLLNSSLDSLETKFLANLDITSEADSLEEPMHIYGNGFFRPPNQTDQDTLVHFDLEFPEVRMWILSKIIPHIFPESAGRGTGYGEFVATKDDFDYYALLSVDSLYLNPNFLNTDYYLSGPIYLTRNEGVIVDTVLVEDDYGNGELFGTIDLNDFQFEKFFDLTFDLHGLQFMNNDFDEDVPFFGNVRGSGKVVMNGSSLNPIIATPDGIQISEGSEFKLPLLDETEFDEQNKFIRYTDSFDDKGLTAVDLLKQNQQEVDSTKLSIFTREKDNIQRTFTEIFNLDLRFNAPQQTYIELIFDNVTNEVMRAQGYGDINVSMRNEELTLYGKYNLESGYYNFVSGDIITRTFKLERGGSIIWDGDPANANINVQAAYRQRADFSAYFANANSSSTLENSNAYRFPIEMILQIDGRLQSIQNDFYFRIPSDMEISSNTSTINNILGSVNNEQYKLYQATSFLLTGNFLPLNTAAGAGSNANQLVINRISENPDALISPLLSSQINSLLNSNIGSVFKNLEFDINLNTLDQIDFGVALRLFNERLTIRREGLITGNAYQNNIGDLGATYQLSTDWSVLVFHRQDPIFSNISSGNAQQANNTQVINGIGVEWQHQFNSWSELGQKIQRGWGKFFGIKPKEANVEDDNIEIEENTDSFTQRIKSNEEKKE